MPKLKNVTEEELNVLYEKAGDLIEAIAEASDKLSKLYHDKDLKNLSGRARLFARLSETSSNLVFNLLTTEKMENMRRESEELKRQTAA